MVFVGKAMVFVGKAMVFLGQNHGSNGFPR